MHPTVLRGMILRRLDPRLEEARLVLGIDPGHRLGLSVYYLGREIESSFYSSADLLIAHAAAMLSDIEAERRAVKIGNGDMALARGIGEQLRLKSGRAFDLEFVDERGTSLKTRNFNQRGRRDRMSARYIIQRGSVGVC